MSATRRALRLGLLFALLAVAVAVYFYRALEYPPAPPTREDATVFFPFGTSTSEIFRKLEAEGVVRTAWFAEAYYRLARSATSLQAGEYRFARPTPLSVVIARMGHGDVLRHTIVVPEGLTAEETFELFWSRGISRPEAFRNALRNPQLVTSIARGAPDLEGFLFPDTYEVTRSTSARRIVETMLANFRRHFTPDMRAQAQAAGLSEREAVVLASIVQKETSLDREEALIAGVYWNRLRHRMRLQADPTVTYALKRDGRVDRARCTGPITGTSRRSTPTSSTGCRPAPSAIRGSTRSRPPFHRPAPTTSTSSPTAAAATPSRARSRSTSTPSPRPGASAPTDRAKRPSRTLEIPAASRPRCALTIRRRSATIGSSPSMTTERLPRPFGQYVLTAAVGTDALGRMYRAIREADDRPFTLLRVLESPELVPEPVLDAIEENGEIHEFLKNAGHRPRSGHGRGGRDPVHRVDPTQRSHSRRPRR